MTEQPSLRALTWEAFKIGCLGFGGPAGQIALMHRIFVDERKWIDEARYLHALNYCMLLPGPEAQQLATYVGWLLHGVRGGVVAGVLFVAPGALVMLGLSLVYVTVGHLPSIEAAMFGVRAAVVALVAEALLRVGKRALKARLHWWIAVASFLALWLAQAPFPLVILVAGGFGFFTAMRTPSSGEPPQRTPLGPPLRSAGMWGALWATPPLSAALLLSPGHVLTQIGLLFSGLALVTFGGAYATLAYLAQQAVDAQHWMSAAQMVDGLGLAETTPGPLVLVNQFVGFQAGWNSGGLGVAIAGAAMASWCTFAPSFVWIFAGAPLAERLRENPRAASALRAITAATFGVIANMAVWFALHVLFSQTTRATLGLGLSTLAPELASFRPAAAVLCAIMLVLTFGFRFGPLRLVGSAIVLGLALSALGWT